MRALLGNRNRGWSSYAGFLIAISWSLRNDIRVLVYNILFPPKIQAWHWRESGAYLCFSLLGSTRHSGVFPRQLPVLPRYVPLALCLLSKWSSLTGGASCSACLLWRCEFGKYRGPGKREIPNCCVRNEMQSKEKGKWDILVISKVHATPDHLLQSVEGESLKLGH